MLVRILKARWKWFVVVGLFSGYAAVLCHIGLLYADKHYWSRRHQFLGYPQNGVAVAMVGDSRMERGDKWFNLQCGNVANFGIGFDSTGGVLNRINDVIRVKPRIVVLEIGINDIILNWNWASDTEILANIREIVAELRQGGSSVVVNPILPTTAKYASDPSFHEKAVKYLVGRTTADRLRALNAKIRTAFTGDHGATFIDLPELRTIDGWLPLNLADKQGLHPNAEGYRLWAKALAPALKDVCKPR